MRERIYNVSLLQVFLAWVIALPAFAAVSAQASPGPLTPALTPVQAGAESAAEGVESGQAWRFRVYLDDREIGYHHFRLADAGDRQVLHSEADFEYRLMFLTLYEYEHENRETWSGDCLYSVDSRTDANGEPFSVEGRRTAGAFRVQARGDTVRLPECVMSFAYWNPAFLRQQRLLNTQNGEYLEIAVSDPVPESRVVRGEQRPALRYRLEAGELSLDLWYSIDNEWLALESEVKGGRTLRYELM